jgi:putative Mn2+ efflux pump MntP
MGVACRNSRRADVWCCWEFGLNICREEIMIGVISRYVSVIAFAVGSNLGKAVPCKVR